MEIRTYLFTLATFSLIVHLIDITVCSQCTLNVYAMTPVYV